MTRRMQLLCSCWGLCTPLPRKLPVLTMHRFVSSILYPQGLCAWIGQLCCILGDVVLLCGACVCHCSLAVLCCTAVRPHSVGNAMLLGEAACTQANSALLSPGLCLALLLSPRTSLHPRLQLCGQICYSFRASS